MKILLLLLVQIFVSCSLAPITTPRSAQTLGEGNNQIDLMPLVPVLGVNYQRGITSNFDLGASFEQQLTPVASVFGKYAFINKTENFSLATIAGAFYGSGIVETTGFHVGPITSYRKKWFEAYFYPRYNYLRWDGSSLTDDQEDNLVIDIVDYFSAVTIQYVQADVGISFHTSPTYHFGLGASYLYVLSTSHVDGGGGAWLPEIFMGWKF